MQGNAGSLIPRSGRSPGGHHGKPLQDSCLENPRQRSLVGLNLWGCKEPDTIEVTQHTSAHIYTPPNYLESQNRLHQQQPSAALWLGDAENQLEVPALFCSLMSGSDFSSCCMRAQQLWLLGARAQPRYLWCSDLVASWRVRSSQIRDQTHVSCASRQILYH